MGAGDADDGYDSDGCVARADGDADSARARRAWSSACRGSSRCWTEIATWNQTTSTVEITVELPANTRGRDVRVTVDDGALTVWTSWHGVVEGLSGALARRVKADETAWSVASDALEVVLAKDADRDGDPWGCVFADARLGCAKSPREVLKDMVFADEPFDSADDFSLESRALLGEMRQRHAALVRGALVDPGDDLDFKLGLALNANARFA